MKKRIIALFVLLLFCLSSCVGNNSDKAENSGGMITGNLVVTKKTDKKFVIKKWGLDVDVGIGRYHDYWMGYGPYYSVTLKINAPGFTIILPDGTTADEKCSVVYSDFDDDKYKVRRGEDGNYMYVEMELESFRFIYKGDEIYRRGKINFFLSYIDEDELTSEEIEKGFFTDGNGTIIYYCVYGPFLKVSKKGFPV